MLQLFNNCLTIKTFPKTFKLAYIILIFKSGKHNDIANYRPIALLNWCSKIFEIYLNSKLLQFCMKNNIINTRQYGFMPCLSTKHALTDLLITIQNLLLNKKYVACLFLDLKKAFDCVDHNLLIKNCNTLIYPFLTLFFFHLTLQIDVLQLK